MYSQKELKTIVLGSTFKHTWHIFYTNITMHKLDYLSKNIECIKI
jgi:hypothetical protein